MNKHPDELLSGYVDGELNSKQRKEVATHLDSCKECRKIVKDLELFKSGLDGDVEIDEITAKRFLNENRERRKPIEIEKSPYQPKENGPGMVEYGAIAGLIMIITISVFVALGGPLRSMFEDVVSTDTLGKNQAALSAGIY